MESALARRPEDRQELLVLGDVASVRTRTVAADPRQPGEALRVQHRGSVGRRLRLQLARWGNTLGVGRGPQGLGPIDRTPRLLTRVGAGMVATFAGAALGRSDSATDIAVDDGIAAHAAVTASYWRLDGAFGPRTVYAQALDHHRVLNDWLAQTSDPGLWPQVAGLAANSGVLLGWLHFDLEQHDQAAHVYRRILDIADRLGDVNLQAFVIGRMSRTLSECERHGEALALAEHAERQGRCGARPAVRSWLAATRAYVHACVGDERTSRAELDRAFSLLEEESAEGLPTYIAFYGQPNLQKWAGHTMLRLADGRSTSPQDARSAIERALAYLARFEVCASPVKSWPQPPPRASGARDRRGRAAD